MEPAERRRFAVAMPIAWLGIAVGMFLYLFDLDRLDDYAGWLVVVVVTQVPAYLAVVTATDEQRFATGRALALAIPAALMIALAMFFVGAVAGLAIWKPVPFEFRPLLIGVGAAVVALIVSIATLVRLLICQPHRGAARRVVGRVAIAG
ncbi:MAG: hypothetical protein H7138_23600, partial [Myxococcales bacterium]|nr:hypothetical protein [Myxococcales bacterium]